MSFGFREILYGIKNELINILSFGIVNTTYELIILGSFFLFLLILVIFRYKQFFFFFKSKLPFFVLSGSIVFLYVLGYSFMQTSAYLIPYLSMSLLYIFLFRNLMKIYLDRSVYADYLSLAGILMIFLLVGFESLKELNHYRARNNLFSEKVTSVLFSL